MVLQYEKILNEMKEISVDILNAKEPDFDELERFTDEATADFTEKQHLEFGSFIIWSSMTDTKNLSDADIEYGFRAYENMRLNIK